MVTTKREVLSVRISPHFKAALLTAAVQQHKNLTVMVEVVVAHYCQLHRIPLGSPTHDKLSLRLKLSTAPRNGSSLPEVEQTKDHEPQVVSVRVPPHIKGAIQAAAKRDLRSVANMMEVMVAVYCRTNGIHVQGLPDEALPLFGKEQKL